MKTPFTLGTLLFLLGLTASVTRGLEAPKPAPEPSPELTVVVVESLSGNHRNADEFDRISLMFTEVFEKRKWPLKIKVERFAANSPAHEIELRVFSKPVRSETPSDLTFSAWMTLANHGAKQDFGIIKFRFYPRPWQRVDDSLDAATRGAAEIVANKIEAVLFPPAKASKP